MITSVRLGMGLPNSIPGVDAGALSTWAWSAEACGFHSLATIDRVAYPCHDSLISLAAAAVATTHIRLLTNVLIGPTRAPVLLAKEAATLDQVSGGRLCLGLGVGARQDDYVAVGQEFHDRGRRWDDALEVMHAAWRGDPVAGSSHPVSPAPVRAGRVPVLIGGSSEQALRRAARWAVGWTYGSWRPGPLVALVERLRAVWSQADRQDAPTIVALQYFALGRDADERASSYLGDYYGYRGEDGRALADGVPRSAKDVTDTVEQLEEADADEIVFFPCSGDPDQVQRLADALFG